MTELRASLKSGRRFSLNWSYLNAIANGVSAIDLGALALRNLHDARQFVREYGFDLEQRRRRRSSPAPTARRSTSSPAPSSTPARRR